MDSLVHVMWLAQHHTACGRFRFCLKDFGIEVPVISALLCVIFWEQVHGNGLVQRHRCPAHTAMVSEAPWWPPSCPPPILGPVSARLSPACLVSLAHPLRNGWLPNVRRIEVNWNLLSNEYIIWQSSRASSMYRTCLGQVCRW